MNSSLKRSVQFFLSFLPKFFHSTTFVPTFASCAPTSPVCLSLCKALPPQVLGILHPLLTLQNKEPVTQVLQQIVNLSCFLSFSLFRFSIVFYSFLSQEIHSLYVTLFLFLFASVNLSFHLSVSKLFFTFHIFLVFPLFFACS